MVAGVGLRLVEYATNRGLWLDEASLKINLVEGSLWNPWGEITQMQVAPPFYILMERWLSRLSGGANLVMRLPSLVASVGALGLLWAMGRRVLPTRGALVALGLLAVSSEQIYFSSELKPYGLDLTVGLGLMLAAMMVREAGLSRKRLAGLAALGAVCVWFSFSSVFVLAGVGIWLMVGEIWAGRWWNCAGLVVVGAVWMVSFGAEYQAARSEVGGSTDLWRFWEIGFMPSVWEDPLWVPRRLLFLFVSPLDFHGLRPIGREEWVDSRLAAAPAIGASLLGLGWLARRRAKALGLFGLPIGAVLIASRLRLYPFHGRLVMFVVPVVLIMVAAGVEVVWSSVGRWAAVGLIVVMTATAVTADVHHLVVPGSRGNYHPLGDRRPGWMMPDYFGTGPHHYKKPHERSGWVGRLLQTEGKRGQSGRGFRGPGGAE
jgi:hypothetical protein